MLFVIALAYSLLCVRLRLRVDAAVANGQGSASLSLGALGICLCREYTLACGWSPPFVRAKPRYGKTRPAKGKKRSAGRWIRLLRAGQMEHVSLHIRLGLGDACETAVTAGAVHALACASLAPVCDLRVLDLHVSPDFAQPGLCVHLSGACSCRLGDMLFAALRRG